MTAAFTWLNDLMSWFGRWIPRLVLIRATQLGVRYGRKGRMTTVQPGLCLYWPMTQALEIVSTVNRTLCTCPQLHNFEAIGVVITFRVTDPKQMLLTFSDLVANLDQSFQASLARVYRRECSNDELSAAIRGDISDKFRDSGVVILDVGINQRSFVIPLKNLSDWSNHEAHPLKEAA